MAFELYNPEGPRRTREPTVTIYSGEQSFSLNRSAFSALGEPQQIHLYYDRDTRLVGIGPAAKRRPAALNLKTGRGGALLSGGCNRVYASACPTIWLGRKVASTAMLGVFQEVWCGHTGYV